MKSFKRGLKEDNRGVTLVELVMAIALLAILIVPVFNSFISSARINSKARQLMAATDAAQTIFEGFSDKGYATIKDDIENRMGAVMLSANHAYATISDNYFNDPANFVSVNVAGTEFAKFNSTNISTIAYDGVSYNTVDIVSANATGFSTVSINEIIARTVSGDIALYPIAIRGWVEPTGGNMSVIIYNGIEVNGFPFDVVATFIPTAKTESEKFYTYCVTITVYDARDNVEGGRMSSESYLFSMKGGIPNK